MKVRHTLIRGFRNLNGVDLWPNEHLNVLVGANGSGKTNFCEAFHFASTGRNLRGSSRNELIGWDSSYLLLRFELINEDRLTVYLRKGEGKRLELNNKAVKQSQVRSQLPVLSFTPDELVKLKGGPKERRRMLDEHLGFLSSEYGRMLGDYESELKKKNALLKKEKPDEEFLEVLDKRLAKLGAEVMARRGRFLERLNGLLPRLYRELAPEAGRLSLNYRNLPEGEIEVDRLKVHLEKRIEESKERERRLETTVVGPHRDKIEYFLGERPLRKYGSQGEQRSATIATYLAFLKLYEKDRQDWPLLLLDDILSELDEERSRYLLENLPEEPQIFLTTTELSRKLSELLGVDSRSILRVREGNIYVDD